MLVVYYDGSIVQSPRCVSSLVAGSAGNHSDCVQDGSDL